MSKPGGSRPEGASAFSTYASRFLNSKKNGDSVDQESSQIFRAASPTSPSHDPFLPSPSASRSHPHLRGSSRSPSPSPTRTPPFPGPGLAGIPSIEDSDEQLDGSIGMGLLFNAGSGSSNSRRTLGSHKKQSIPPPPNPYAPSSASDEEIEADLEEVATVRRSLLKSKQQPSSIQRNKKGWLAHQSVFPASSSSDETDSEKETEPDTDADSQSMIMGKSRYNRSKSRQHTEDSEAGPSLPPYQVNTDLDEPLLGPEDGEDRGVEIPDRLEVYHGRFAHWERTGLRKYKDSGFLALWLTSILGVMIGLLFVWGSTDAPAGAPKRSAPSVIPLLPLLLVLLIPTFVIPPLFFLLLQKTVRPVLLATAVSIPFSLFICGWWAFGASFESLADGADAGGQWWGTTGMRLCAVVLWLLAAGFGRLVWVRRKRLEQTVSVVELSTQLLLQHPPLLLLTPLLLAVFAVISIPFLTLLVRLGTIGYWRHPRENTWVFHIRPYAGWLIFLVTLLWIWTWGVVRGVGRVTVAAVVGEWFFHRESWAQSSTIDTTVAALHRATGTSLGSICLGAGIVAVFRTIGKSAARLKLWTSPRANILPSPLTFLSKLSPIFAVVAGILDQLNGYALVYVGITGGAFWPSARKAVDLTGRRKVGHLLDYTLIKLLLTLSTTALALFTATSGYLYMAHSLGNPGYAPVAALLCGGVPFLAARAGAAVLGDVADALFICYQIDREANTEHCEEAKAAFSEEKSRQSAV